MMAEFQKVMREWKRMCKSRGNIPDDFVGAESALLFAFDRPEEIERLVMEWAAEHPEPVYPTWAEWLLEIGGGEKKHIETGGYSGNTWVTDYETFVVALDSTIPDNTARMLGVKPKEG